MKKTQKNAPKEETTKKTCGIIMSDSELPAAQWQDVKEILENVIIDAGFEPKLLASEESETIDVGMIQDLHNNEIIICDVSGKDPNVMFKLGVCLAFNKPTIIIKNDKTNYSFVSSGLKYLEYPKDLRFNKIVEFKEKLKEKIKNAHKQDQQSENEECRIFKRRRKNPDNPKHSTKECKEMVKLYIDMFPLDDYSENVGLPARDMLLEYLNMSLVGIMFEDRNDLEEMVDDIIGKSDKLKK